METTTEFATLRAAVATAWRTADVVNSYLDRNPSWVMSDKIQRAWVKTRDCRDIAWKAEKARRALEAAGGTEADTSVEALALRNAEAAFRKVAAERDNAISKVKGLKAFVAEGLAKRPSGFTCL